MRRKGADAPSFDTIIASGPNSALPHARPGTPKDPSGGLRGHRLRGRLPRVPLGRDVHLCCRPGGKEAREIYAVVKEAHDRALEAVRPGVACRDVDAAARGVIEKAGYGSCFSHGTGHGVGLDVHEAPRLSTLSDAVLEEGMVITIEPGIYIPGFGGVRIEDTVLVEKGGARVLTEFSKELQVIGVELKLQGCLDRETLLPDQTLNDSGFARCDAKTRPAGSDSLRRGRSASPRTVTRRRFNSPSESFHVLSRKIRQSRRNASEESCPVSRKISSTAANTPG